MNLIKISKANKEDEEFIDNTSRVCKSILEIITFSPNSLVEYFLQNYQNSFEYSMEILVFIYAVIKEYKNNVF